MKIHLRDILLLIVIISVGLVWWKDRLGHEAAVAQLQSQLKDAQSVLPSRDREIRIAKIEADVLAEEVRRLRGVVKASLDDQREWFALEVQGKKLVAIRAGTSETNVLSMELVNRIEAETGLEATRLRHFLAPISELKLDR